MSRANNWLMTLNNPEEDPQEYLKRFFNKTEAVYVVGQLEQGAEGTLHIQFFANYKAKCSAGKIKKFDNKLHIEKVKVNNGADTYCMKEETRVEGPYTFGVKPIKRNDKHDWEEVK